MPISYSSITGEGDSALSSGPTLWPVLPSPPSPALVEWGVYVRVHPEWPERVICAGKKEEGSAWKGQGLENWNWGLEKESALRNSAVGSLTQIEDGELRERRHHRRPVCVQGGGAFSGAQIQSGSGHLKAVQDCHLMVEGGKGCSKCQRDRTLDHSDLPFSILTSLLHPVSRERTFLPALVPHLTLPTKTSDPS